MQLLIGPNCIINSQHFAKCATVLCRKNEKKVGFHQKEFATESLRIALLAKILISNLSLLSNYYHNVAINLPTSASKPDSDQDNEFESENDDTSDRNYQSETDNNSEEYNDSEKPSKKLNASLNKLHAQMYQ